MTQSFFKKMIASVDWVLLGAVIFVSVAGIITMDSFLPRSGGAPNDLFERQIIWLSISTALLIVASTFDWRFLRKTGVIISIFGGACFLLALLFVLGSVFKGAQSWFNLGVFSFQPVDLAKLAIIFLLAKYFSRRHIEIANVRHIITSGFYAGIIFLLVLLQPDFGSAIIIAAIWFAMVLVSGISKKHLSLVIITAIVSFSLLWGFAFKPYQKARIMTFIHPLTDLTGAGYNAYQSTVAVGSGEIFGKGVGYGSQSKLKFLPEYETDFIFAAYSEEWGLVGVCVIFLLYGIIFWRILDISKKGATNFETLCGLGVFSLFLSQSIIHVGMNVGLLPVTGITMPFMSYGGSHLLAEFLALGILMGQGAYGRVADRHLIHSEVVGV